MKESRKFYYIDKNGNKKKYVGKIIANNDSYNGILTTVLNEEVKKELFYHPEIKEVKGYSSYYSYVNSFGEDTIYLDIVKRDDDGNFYFTYNDKFVHNLNYHPTIEPVEEYYTYIDKNGNECRYSGNVIHEKGTNSFIGFIDKK